MDILGKYLRDLIKLNAESRNFRLMGPDETESNKLDAVYRLKVGTEPACGGCQTNNPFKGGKRGR